MFVILNAILKILISLRVKVELMTIDANVLLSTNLKLFYSVCLWVQKLFWSKRKLVH